MHADFEIHHIWFNHLDLRCWVMWYFGSGIWCTRLLSHQHTFFSVHHRIFHLPRDNTLEWTHIQKYSRNAIHSFAWGVMYTSSNLNMRFTRRKNHDVWQSGWGRFISILNGLTITKPSIGNIEPGHWVLPRRLVITQPDPSFNINLYLINRRGWWWATKQIPKAFSEEGKDKISYRHQQACIDEHPHLNRYMVNPFGAYQIIIYDLTFATKYARNLICNHASSALDAKRQFFILLHPLCRNHFCSATWHIR
jgi:hypothetical protein